jgi:hypothetical protein
MYFQSGQMDTKFQIINVGLLPAYIQIHVVAQANGKTVPNVCASEKNVSVLIPGQRIWVTGQRINGEAYRKIPEGDTSKNFVQEIRIDYGSERNNMEYYTWQKIQFDSTDLPKIVENTERPGLWNATDSNFK